MVLSLVSMFRAHYQSHSIIRHLAQLRLNGSDASLRDAIDGTGLIGSSALLCLGAVVHGGRKAWYGPA